MNPPPPHNRVFHHLFMDPLHCSRLKKQNFHFNGMIIACSFKQNIDKDEEEKPMEKKLVFLRCDHCIGITPCRLSKDGKFLCNYCRHEIKAASPRSCHLMKNHPRREARL